MAVAPPTPPHPPPPVSERLSPRGWGSRRRHGDVLRRASQLPSGTINKHQSLVNISAAAAQQPGARGGAAGSVMERWRRTKGRQAGWEEDRQGDGDHQMKGEKRQKGGGSEKAQKAECVPAAGGGAWNTSRSGPPLRVGGPKLHLLRGTRTPLRRCPPAPSCRRTFPDPTAFKRVEGGKAGVW